ncbi:MAG: DUF2357 domain-containing protein [Kiritimatiellae bacterium]|nr:DUF2357 domain-containing protein [Kiritimatiellia bacterium]
MLLFLEREPWALLTEEASGTVKPDGNRPVLIRGDGSPRVVVSADLGVPSFGSQRAKRDELASVSFPFFWAGQRAHMYALPANHRPHPGRHSFTHSLDIGGQQVWCAQEHLIGRPDLEKEHGESQEANAWMEWMVNCFRLLHNLDELCDDAETKTTRGLSRRVWGAADRVWRKDQTKEAPLHLVVSLAKDVQLVDALETCTSKPRRILKRIRADQKVEKIQELDSACIRDFARRPGTTIQQKAGARRELLSVSRIENMDTLENRVLCWVLREVAALAVEYRSEFDKGERQSDPKVRDVRKMLVQTRDWRMREPVSSVLPGQLRHPVHPNYPLQFDAKYHRVYAAYRSIIEHKKVMDDAWTWHRVLWAEAARQILYAALASAERGGAWSSAYYFGEGSRGRWTAPPVAPGPFTLPRLGETYVFDAIDVIHDKAAKDALLKGRLFPGSDIVGATGCDTVLDCQGPQALPLQLLVWCVLLPVEDSISVIARRCQIALSKYQTHVRQRRVSGLVIAVGGTPSDPLAPVSITGGPATNLPSMFLISTSIAIRNQPAKLSEAVSEALAQITDMTTCG